jgi:uncharacterized membrane protein YeaQ/YmgE (transglycosylase-associated protein family)
MHVTGGMLLTTVPPAIMVPGSQGPQCTRATPAGAAAQRFGTQENRKEAMEPHGIIVWLVIGAIAGWLAGKVVRGGGYGLIGDIVVGIIGAVIAGYLFPYLHIYIASGIVGSIIDAFIGAVILLVLLRLVRRA